MATAKSVFKTKFDYNEQVRGTVSENTDISLNVMFNDKEILAQMSTLAQELDDTKGFLKSLW